VPDRRAHVRAVGPNVYEIDGATVKHDELTKEIERLQNDTAAKISTTPITVHAQGPGMDDLVLVDLPGIIHTNGGKDDVLQLIRQFTTPEQTLILTITEASRDEETALALQLAADADPSGERTLRILTKFDKFDSPEKRADAVAIVRGGEGELRPHAVVCRPNGSAYHAATELTKLGDVEGQGVQTLKARLPALLGKRIDVNLPALKRQVRETRELAEARLSELGAHELNTTQILLRVQSAVRDVEFDLSRHVREAADTLRKHGRCGKKKNQRFVEGLVDELYRHDLFTTPFFQGERTFNKCLRAIVDIWRPVLGKLRAAIRNELEGFLPPLNGVSRALKSNLSDSWGAHCRAMMAELEARTDAALKKETKHSTMNHYLTAKYENHFRYPTSVQDYIVSHIDTLTVCEKGAPDFPVRTLNEIKDNVRQIVEDALDDHEARHAKHNLEDQRKDMIVATVKANTTVSLKTLTDNVMAAVREVVYEGKERWVNVVLLQLEGAAEDEFTKSERKKNLSVKQEMEACAALLRSIS
jgi:predicted nucleic acid-binding protein